MLCYWLLPIARATGLGTRPACSYGTARTSSGGLTEMRRFLHATTMTIVGLSMVIASGCFSYHKTTTETPAQVEPSEPPAQSTTTSTTTQTNDGSVREHSTTTTA